MIKVGREIQIVVSQHRASRQIAPCDAEPLVDGKNGETLVFFMNGSFDTSHKAFLLILFIEAHIVEEEGCIDSFTNDV